MLFYILITVYLYMGQNNLPLIVGLTALLLLPLSLLASRAGFLRLFRRSFSKVNGSVKDLKMSDFGIVSELEKVMRQMEGASVDDDNQVSFAGKGLKLDTENDAEQVCEAIRNCPQMLTLCLEGNTIGVDAAKAIAKTLESAVHFKNALWKDMFTGRLKSEIPDALNYLSGGIMLAGARLIELDLSDNAFGPVGVKGIVSLLKSPACETLQILKLNNNGLGITGGKLLAQSLQHNADRNATSTAKFRLRTFICGRNRLENEGAKAIAQVIKTLGSLQEVAMPQNGIYHEGVSAIADALSHNSEIRVVNFNDNTFTELGAKAFAKNLGSMQKLEIINFGDCLLKTEGAMALADALKDGHTELKELHLGFNEIGESGGLAIAEAMEGKNKLQKLEINGNVFGSSGCQMIEGTLDAFGLSCQLGSLSEDEGLGDDEDEDDSEGDDDENDVEGGYTELDDHHTPEESLSNLSLTKVTADEFVAYPTDTRLMQIGNNRASLLLEQLGTKPSNEKLVERFILVSQLVSLNSDIQIQNAVNDCCDKLMNSAFNFSTNENSTNELTNVILVHLGLIKSEDKKFKAPVDLRGPLMALEFCIRQPYFSKKTKNTLQLFLSHPKKSVDSCGPVKHKLMQTLYQS